MMHPNQLQDVWSPVSEGDANVTAGDRHAAIAETPSLGHSVTAEVVLTVHASEAIQGALLMNLLNKVRERGNLLGFRVDDIDDNGRNLLWLKMATEKQATRIKQRLNGLMIMNGTVALTVDQSAISDWPPGFVPDGERVAPKAKAHSSSSGSQTKGGVRHKCKKYLRGHNVYDNSGIVFRNRGVITKPFAFIVWIRSCGNSKHMIHIARRRKNFIPLSTQLREKPSRSIKDLTEKGFSNFALH